MVACPAGAGRGEAAAPVTSQQRSAVSRESRRPVKAPAPRKRKRRRLNDLDSDSTQDEEESEDEFQLSDRCVCKLTQEYLQYQGIKSGLLGFKSGGFYTISSKYNTSHSQINNYAFQIFYGWQWQFYLYSTINYNPWLSKLKCFTTK